MCPRRGASAPWRGRRFSPAPQRVVTGGCRPSPGWPTPSTPRSTPGEQPHVFVSFENLLRDWRSEMDRVSRALDIAWPEAPDAVAEAVDEFIEPGLAHDVAEDDLPGAVSAVNPLYDVLQRWSADDRQPGDEETIDSWRAVLAPDPRAAQRGCPGRPGASGGGRGPAVQGQEARLVRIASEVEPDPEQGLQPRGGGGMGVAHARAAARNRRGAPRVGRWACLANPPSRQKEEVTWQPPTQLMRKVRRAAARRQTPPRHPGRKGNAPRSRGGADPRRPLHGHDRGADQAPDAAGRPRRRLRPRPRALRRHALPPPGAADADGGRRSTRSPTSSRNGAEAKASPEINFNMESYLARYPARADGPEQSPYLEWLKRGKAAGEIADPAPGLEKMAPVLGMRASGAGRPRSPRPGRTSRSGSGPGPSARCSPARRRWSR